MRGSAGHTAHLQVVRAEGAKWAQRYTDSGATVKVLAQAADVSESDMAEILRGQGVDLRAVRKAHSLGLRDQTGHKGRPKPKPQARSIEDLAQEARLDHD